VNPSTPLEPVEPGEPLEPSEHLAADFALWEAAEAGCGDQPVRCWQIERPVVVLGRHGVAAREIDENACGADGVPVLRRFSGGGAVVLGRGCLNYAVALSLASHPALADVAASFRFVLRALVAVLAVPGLSIMGGTDLALNGRKVSGNAQRRGRRAIIHHGTLLYAFDPALATRYLKEPGRQPAYRAARRHADFLGNLPLSSETIRVRLQAAWERLLSFP
jgi:lipoate-protein ligase A